MSLTRKISSSFLVLLFAAATARTAPSQTLEEYKQGAKKADAGEGCSSIPNKDWADRCERKQSDMKGKCENDKWSCQKLLETKQLKSNIDGKDRNISSLKTQRDDWNSRKSSAKEDERRNIESKIKALEDTIYNESKELDFMKKSLDTDRSDADIRIYKGRQCLEARDAVQEVFRDARSAAQSVSDAEIKPFANRLIEFWEKGARDHEEASRTVKEGIEYCEKCKSGDL